MNQMLSLLALNKGKGQPIRMEKSGDQCSIYIYDIIVSDDFFGGISAAAFTNELMMIDAPEIHLRINSPGGDVFASKAMAQAIREHSSRIIAHVDGVAASAATFLTNAADKTIISSGGMFMIHNAWTYAGGNAADFTETASLLSRIDKTLINDYALVSGKTTEEIKQWMDAETYFFGQEAVDAGFIDSIAEETANNEIKWNFSAYKHAPIKDEVEPIPMPIPEPEPEPEKPDLSAHYRSLKLIELTA